MNKVAVITFHHTPNYGAVLQTFALQKTIEKLGFETKVIDYRNQLIEKNFQKLKFYEFKNPINYINYLYKWKFLKIKLNNFETFINNNIKKTEKKYYNTKELNELNEIYNIFICGSDQVWNYKITNFDKNYFLDFVNSNNKKISYAASFGLQEISNEYKKEYYNLLKNFDNISVREMNGVQLIKKICKGNAKCVLDPTMLLTKKEWLNYLNISNSKNSYILLYELEENNKMLEFAKNIASDNNMILVVISNRKKIENKNKNIIDAKTATPNEFLSYIANAKYIITNSFHGMVFSIIFNKQFSPFLLNNASSVNSRIINLLNTFSLSYRINKNDFNEINRKIDYVKINKLLNNLKKESLTFLKESLGVNNE